MKKAVAIMLAGVMGMMSLAGCQKEEAGGAAPSAGTQAAEAQAKEAADPPEEEKKGIDFPKKEITLIVPFTAGGATDVMARQMQPIFKDKLDVNLVVKNVEGGGSLIGITEALTSKPDGYTLGLATSSFISMAAQGMSELGIDDGTNITSLSEDPLVLVVKEGGTYASAEDFIAAAKAEPGTISICQAGTNNANHAFAKLLAKASDIELLEMTYDGASRAVTEIIGGNCDGLVCKPADCITQVQAGEVKILGSFTHERVGILGDVPTFEELGYDVFSLGDIAMVTYIVAPKDLNPQIQEKLAEMFRVVLTSDEFQAIADERGFVSSPVSGDDLDGYIKNIYGGLKSAGEQLFVK